MSDRLLDLSGKHDLTEEEVEEFYMLQDEQELRDSIRKILESIDGTPLRHQLLETPNRVVKAMSEIFDGYQVDIDSLFTSFDGEGKDQIVVVKDIETWSVCEHHLLPFHLQVAVAYLPFDRVIGVSKIERLVHAYAHRLQLQERITEQVANTLMDKLRPQGVGVIIEGEHLCMRMRGVKGTGKVVTSVMLGEFRESPGLRQELLGVLRK